MSQRTSFITGEKYELHWIKARRNRENTVDRQLKQDYRGAVAYVSERTSQSSKIIVMPDVADGPFEYYYQGNATLTYTSNVTALPDNTASVYFVADDFGKDYAKSVTLSYLNENYQRNDNYTGIHIYERR